GEADDACAEALRAVPESRAAAPRTAPGAAAHRHRTAAAGLKGTGAGPRGEPDRSESARWERGYAHRREIAPLSAAHRTSCAASTHSSAPSAAHPSLSGGEINRIAPPVQDPGSVLLCLPPGRRAYGRGRGRTLSPGGAQAD